MKLITAASTLEVQFTRLIRKYDVILWTTAWASVGSKPFQELLTAKHKIDRLVVGLHFYQTHPDFIKAFIDHKRVRYIKQPQGTFHPKLYLFRGTGGQWELLVGSPNFTGAAFSGNTEATMLISHDDVGASSILPAAVAAIDSSWQGAERFTEAQLTAYRRTWKTQRAKVQSLSGQYGAKHGPAKPIYEVAIATMTWRKFVDLVKNDPYQSMSKRLRVLEKARDLFGKYKRFSEMATDERKFVAGLPNSLRSADLDSDWFGTMRGSGVFGGRIVKNNENISRALDHIPLNGQLTRTHFDAFVGEYRKALKGDFIATATRLLAMKRPDTFVCLDSRNRSGLCKAFGIPQAGMNYEKYWEAIVERLFDSEWWQEPKPVNGVERHVSDARAAFLDSLYYIEA